MIYPQSTLVESPSEDLPDDVKSDYLEASNILQSSPRGSAALLRLAIQKLCDHLITGGGNLNFKIGKLVENGLNKKIQQALDIVRVIGNEAVHPGQIDLRDETKTAENLFKLVNTISYQMITEPAEIEAMYGALPEEKRKQVEERDTKDSRPE